jgi:hypothetical protein
LSKCALRFSFYFRLHQLITLHNHIYKCLCRDNRLLFIVQSPLLMTTMVSPARINYTLLRCLILMESVCHPSHG